MIGTQPIVKNNLCPKPNPPSLRAFSKFKFTTDLFILNSAGLLDTGSNVSLIDVNIIPERFANRLTPNGNPINGIGGVTKVLGTVTGKCSIGDADFPNVEFQVVEKLPSNARIIIGTNVLLHPNVTKLSIERVAKCILFEFKRQNSDSDPVLKRSRYFDDIKCADTKVTCHGTQKDENPENKAKEIPRFKTLREKLEYLSKEKDIPLYHSNKDYLEKFADMIIANLSVFGIDGELGCFPTPVAIETKGEPVKIKQHEIAQQFRQDVDKEIAKMLKSGVIEKIKDPKGWNSPILCVAKRDKSVRVCANFKNTINKRLCRPDPFPAPAIEEVFKSIEDGNEFFSSIDLQSGYWQLTIREEDRHKTSFTWRGQTYQFIRLPFGYTAAGNAFSRAVWEALLSVNFDQQHVKSYIDDICILGKDIDTFIANHVQVFDALKKFNLRLKARKCHFLKQEIPFLGCLLSAQGRRPIPEYVQGIMNIKAPKNTKELKQAQGRLTWINGFIGSRMGERVKSTSFSHLIDPILNVSRSAPFKWTKEADKALETIKERMTKPPFISFSDPSLPYVLITDASDTALGGMLCQKKGDQYRVIGTVSKCFTPAERRWSTTEREAYGIVYCVKKFSYFLSRNHFTVFTDHKSLTFMDRKTFNNAKISRWQEELSQYSFHVQYLEGDENVWADWLSRPYTRVANSRNCEAQDTSPAGKFIKIDGTKLTIYVPSWCLDTLDPDLTKLRFKNSRKDILCAVAFNASRTDILDDKPIVSLDYDFRPIIDVEHGYDKDSLPLSLAAFITEKELPENPELFQYLDMAKQQRKDPLFAKIIGRLESPEKLQPGQIIDYIDPRDERSSWFKRNAEKLFIEPMTKLLMLRETQTIKMVVPESMRKQMLRSAHDQMGHCGRNRVLEHLRSMVWPGMYKDTTDYIKSCVGCSEVKGNYGKRPPKPGHNLRGTGPNEVLYLDYIFLKKSNSGYKYALTIIDSFTRYLSVYPSRNNRACDTARFLTDYVVKFGRIPSVISTDRGSHFVGAVMQDLCKNLGIKHNIHCAYRPQSTGILERAHRTLKNSLKIVAEELSKPWPEILGHVVGAMNGCFNQATKCSPFYAMFGKHYCLDIPRLPDNASRKGCFDALTHGMNLDANLAKIHRLVDLCAKDTDYKVDLSLHETKLEKLAQGDKVLIYRPLSAAANAKVEWIGGYSVLRSNEFAAKLKNDENGKTDWVHRDHIRKIYNRPSYLEYDSEDELDAEPNIITLREKSEEKSDPDNSISRGVVSEMPFAKCIPRVIDIESSSSVPQPSVESQNDPPNVTLSDENQMAQELKDALKAKMTNRKNKMNRWSSEGISRRSQRESKAPQRLQVKSMKGKSYDT